MKLSHARHSGRQIPEWMIFSVVLSLSVTFGMPIAARLREHWPQSNKLLWFFAGIAIGFLVLVALCLFISAAAWLLARLWQKFARQK